MTTPAPMTVSRTGRPHNPTPSSRLRLLTPQRPRGQRGLTLVGPGVAVAAVAPSAVGEGVGVRVPWVGPAVGLGPGVLVRVGVPPLPPVRVGVAPLPPVAPALMP